MASIEMTKGSAIVLTNGWLDDIHAKTAHGLLRGSKRFQILGIIDSIHAGKNAGEVFDGKPLDIKVYTSIAEFLKKQSLKPKYCIVGVAVHGGRLPMSLRGEIIQAMRNGLSIVSGLHTFLIDDPEFRQVAAESNVEIIDVRKPRPTGELNFWTGKIYSVRTPRIAMLGMDCAIGKRTTGQFVMDMCHENGINTELIYTGQTGWMQGYKHGFIFDATVNDFIGGEIERVILDCVRESNPDLILIEGQSSLRNPSGPCGSDILLSGNAKGVILQHAPGRKYFDGMEPPHGLMPPVEEEIQLIRMYGARTLAVTLNEEKWDNTRITAYQKELARKLSIPVVRPLKEGVASLLPAIRSFMAESI
jgi:uncharacterized NAD-dependent epimerase/dehydratase family protein